MAAKKETPKQQRLLKELSRLAQNAGFRISYGDMKFGGVKLKSGQCLFKGEPWLVLGTRQNFEEKLALFREALRPVDLSGEDLSPEMMALIRPDKPYDSHQ